MTHEKMIYSFLIGLVLGLALRYLYFQKYEKTTNQDKINTLNLLIWGIIIGLGFVLVYYLSEMNSKKENKNDEEFFSSSFHFY